MHFLILHDILANNKNCHWFMKWLASFICVLKSFTSITRQSCKMHRNMQCKWSFTSEKNLVCFHKYLIAKSFIYPFTSFNNYHPLVFVFVSTTKYHETIESRQRLYTHRFIALYKYLERTLEFTEPHNTPIFKFFTLKLNRHSTQHFQCGKTEEKF